MCALLSVCFEIILTSIRRQAAGFLKSRQFYLVSLQHLACQGRTAEGLLGFVIHGYLGGRVLFTKSVGLAMSVASGLSLGKEGPFVHIASCIGNIVSRIASKYENNEGALHLSTITKLLTDNASL